MSVLPQKIFVIGQGEVGRRITQALGQVATVVPVKRQDAEKWQEAMSVEDMNSTRIVCVREDDLEGVLEPFLSHPQLFRRLILVQNGFLDSIVEKLKKEDEEKSKVFAELLVKASRILVWFTSKGEFFHQLAPSLIYGPECDRISPYLLSKDSRDSTLGTDLRLKFEAIPERREFEKQMIIKGLWNGIVGLPLNYHAGVNIGDLLKSHKQEVLSLLEEMCTVVNKEYEMELKAPDIFDIVEQTTKPIEWMSKKGPPANMDTRNGFLVSLSEKHKLSMPITEMMIWRCTEREFSS